MKKVSVWWHKRQYRKAAKIMKKMAARHLAANHMTESVIESPGHVVVLCHFCPNLEV